MPARKGYRALSQVMRFCRYGRNHLAEIIKEAAKNIFVPFTVGGGIRSVEDAAAVLRSAM